MHVRILGLAVNTGITKYMEIGRHWGVIANDHIKIGRNSYENGKTFKYLGSLLTNENSIQEEIKCVYKKGNSCYYSVQTFLSSRLLSKNLKIKIYKIIILPVVLYGCKTWSPALREESRLRIFENRILRRIFQTKEWKLGVEKAPKWGTIFLYGSPNVVTVIKSIRLRWAGHVARMEESRSAFKILTRKPTGKRPLWRPRRRWEDNIRMDFKEIGINTRNWVDSI